MSFQGAGTIVPTIAHIVHSGDVFQVASTVTGTNITVDNSSALVDFGVDTSGGSLLLKGSVLNPAFVPGISNAGAATLNGLLSYYGSNASLQGVGAAVENLSSLSDVRSAAEQLRPSVNGSAIMVPLNVSSLFQSQIDGRLDALYFGNSAAQRANAASLGLGYAGPVAKEDSTASAAAPGSGTTFWGNLVGSKIEQQTVSSIYGYSASTGGLIAGVDRPLTNNVLLGGAFGYATSSITDDQLLGNNTGIETYQGIVYAGLTLPSWYVSASLGFAWENYTNTRSISFPGFSDAAYSSHDGQFYLGRVEAGYPISFSGFTMVPTASLAWGHLDQDGYTEASPAGAALSIGSEHDNSLRSELGLKAFVPVLASPLSPRRSAAMPNGCTSTPTLPRRCLQALRRAARISWPSVRPRPETWLISERTLRSLD